MIHIDDFEAYCFDLDGTIYVGNQLLPGVEAVINFIRKKQKKLLFLTNAPTKTKVDCLRLLQSFGIDAELEEVMTASSLAAIYFSEICPEARVYVVGEQAIINECKHLSIMMTEKPFEATHVLVGLDRSFSYIKLNEAMNAIRNGAKLIVTNPDPVCPVPGGFIADTLSIAKSIEVASGQAIHQIIGKPSDYCVEKMKRKLLVQSRQCLIIGDRLETDILMGKHHDFPTCLVLTGASGREDIRRTNIEPDYIINNLQSLFTSME